MHEVPPLYLKHVEYVSPNLFDLILSFLACLPPSPSLMHEFLRTRDPFASNGVNVDLDLMINLFDMPKGY